MTDILTVANNLMSSFSYNASFTIESLKHFQHCSCLSYTDNENTSFSNAPIGFLIGQSTGSAWGFILKILFSGESVLFLGQPPYLKI